MYRLHLLRKPKFEISPIKNTKEREDVIIDVEFVLIRIILMCFTICSLTFVFASIFAIPKVFYKEHILGSIIMCVASSLYSLKQVLYLDMIPKRLGSCIIAFICQILALIVTVFAHFHYKENVSIN